MSVDRSGPGGQWGERMAHSGPNPCELRGHLQYLGGHWPVSLQGTCFQDAMVGLLSDDCFFHFHVLHLLRELKDRCFLGT